MKDKVVLVTGSSGGIGLAIAERFLRGGAAVVLNCKKSVSRMEDAAENLKKINENVICVRADISDYGECARMFEKIDARYGRLDALVNNAGVSDIGLLQETGEKTINEIINVNLTGAVYCSKLAAESMVKRKNGAVINISSVWGVAGASCEAVYSASKGGLNAFTKALAKELGPSGVRVNAIACGAVETGMNGWMPEDQRAAFIEKIPLGRFGTPGEIAELAYFLAGSGASYITGQIINADGGLL